MMNSPTNTNFKNEVKHLNDHKSSTDIPILEEGKESIYDNVIDIAESKEILGWCLYSFGIWVFYYVGTNFLQLTLTSQTRHMAEQNYCGDCLNYEYAINYETEGECSKTSFTSNSTCVDAGFTWQADMKNEAKYVDFLGINIGYGSFPFLLNVTSVLIQLVVFIFVGNIGDYSSYRKNLLMLVCSVGVISLALSSLLPNDELFWLNGILWMISQIMFATSEIFSNGFLPLLANSSRPVAELIESNANSSEIKKKKEQMAHSISAKGLAYGFLGTAVSLIFSVGIFLMTPTRNYINNRAVVLFSSIWIGACSVITYMLLHTRPGPEIPKGTKMWKYSLNSTLKTAKEFSKLKEIGKFLLSYFIFSDGCSTVSQTAVLFAQEELNMTSTQISIGLLEVAITACLGCIFFKWLNVKMNISPKTILFLNVVLIGLIPIYAVFGLTHIWEIYIVMAVFGFNTGSQQAFTRSIYSQGIPKGLETQYFAFFKLSDKGSAWAGPLIIAVVFQYTGSYRDAIVALLPFFIIGLAILYFYDAELAYKQKIEFEKILKLT